MRFKLDENLPADAAVVLRRAGHDAATALEQKLGGRPDPALLAVCKREERSFITLDTDFANIQLYPPNEYPGLVVLRLAQQGRRNVLAVFERLLHRFDAEPLSGRLWVVDEARVRIRPGDE